MRISDVANKIENYSSTFTELNRFAQLLKSHQNSIHICDLDLCLLYIYIETVSYIDDKLVDALIDSEYATLFAPNTLNNDVIDYNDELHQLKVKEEIKNTLTRSISNEVIEKIGMHVLLNEIDLNALFAMQDVILNIKNNIKVEVETSKVYSFALAQTGHKLIYNLIIENTSDEAISNIVIKTSVSFDYVSINDIQISELPPHQPIMKSDFAIEVKYEELVKLNEKSLGNISFKIFQDNIELNSIVKEVEFLSYNTWVENLIPNSTAMFVMPNDESVKNIVRLTAQELQKESGRASLDDYQSGDKTIVYDQVKALYNTLYNQGIGYITIPPSYEDVGQKIRIPHDVLTGSQGTCIDLAILFVSCLEAMGLNAGIVLVSGHAYACVFLEETYFQTSPFRDAVHAMDMCENDGDLLFVECTAFTAGSQSSFDEACSIGKNMTITHSNDSVFEIIDINSSRALGYLPLPLSFDVDKIKIDLDVLEQNKIRLKKKDLSESKEKIKLTEAEINKFDIWEKKLLDLTRRNELIDFKADRNGQQIITFESDEGLRLNDIYDAFKDKGYQYDVLGTELLGVQGKLNIPELSEEEFNHCRDSFNNRTVLLMKRKVGFLSALKFFDRERRKALEESGANILYLAIGFIEWYLSDKSSKPIYSPVILVPIDLKRNSKDHYSIVGRSEPAFLNISIFEFFHQEFGMNFDDLLTMNLFGDENVKVDAILNTVGEKLRKLNRARIVKTAAINIFRFSKAVMWQNVKYYRDELVKNKVIKSIIDRTYIIGENEKLIEDFDDDNSNPFDLAIPLSADSSQIKAIKDCADGKSFILQGPPGTGKSQTITNMIVNAIYHGKTVLFVAEKMAALEVVQKRLAGLHLDKFALEVHSIKADKVSVMEQFKKRIDLNLIISNDEKFTEVGFGLKEKRLALNRIINLLHKENNYFISFYDAFVKYVSLDECEIIKLDDEYVESLTEDQFKANSALLSSLYDQLKENGGYIESPFILMQSSDYKPNITRNRLKEVCLDFKSKLSNFTKTFNDFLINNDIKLQRDIDSIKQLVCLLKDEKAKSVILPLLKNNNTDELSSIEELITNGIDYVTRKESIEKDYSKNIMSIDCENYNFELQKYKNSGFFKKMSIKSALLKNIKEYAINPKQVKFENLENLINSIELVNDLKKKLDIGIKDRTDIFGDNDIKDIKFTDLKIKFENTKHILNYYSNAISVNIIKEVLSKLNSSSLYFKEELIQEYESLNETSDVLINEFNFEFDLCKKYGFDIDYLESLFDGILSKLDYLRNWCFFIQTIKEVEEMGMPFICEYIKNTKLEDTVDLSTLYKKSVFTNIINKAMNGDENGSFNAIEIKQRIKEYSDLIDEFSRLTIIETASRITKNTPITNEHSASTSQIGILRNAIGNKCKGKSIRQLFNETKDILTKYFPVFLMSPISCAQYLSNEMPKFDIVIFDEASQMPTCEAIGAISKGKSLIVVGDSMQMPPTTFFQSKGSDEDYVDIEDQESILDDCDVIGMPSRQLDWHYRSKHESLIRFSNARFYNNSLITFPSPNDMVTKVSFENVKGIYDRKGKNVNEIEAAAIVNEIKRRIMDSELCKRSIGVVTFSSSQQNLIEDKLEDMFANNKNVETRYNELISGNNAIEPLIIKNLENIQGDERDIILFSVCYGPTKDGHMYYQFGPINMAGGEKRLNVAFSRARYEMKIYASFEPSILAQMNSNSRGAQELYRFLKYAKNGGSTLAIESSSLSPIKVGIEKDIAQRLDERGYKTKIDVGNSSFRVDVGIVDPENEEQYILGVVCDSYSYENAQTSRDRNVVQPSVLKMLKWNILRIWSFDYLDDKEAVINEIINEIERIRANPERKEPEQSMKRLDINFESTTIDPVSYATEYMKFSRRFKVDSNHESLEFLDSIKVIAKAIIEMESPISINNLYSRVASSICSASAGSLIKANIDVALKDIGIFKSKATYNTFIWKDKNTDLKEYRVSDIYERDFNDIPPQEIIVAIKEVLINYGTMAESELIKMVSKCFKYQVLGPKVKKIISETIDKYIEKGVLESLGYNDLVGLKESKND